MLKALFILDCDQCHQPFERLAAATIHDDRIKTVAWLETADTLTWWAEECGWAIDSRTQMCFACTRKNNAHSRLPRAQC